MVLKEIHDINAKGRGHPEEVYPVTDLSQLGVSLPVQSDLNELQSETGTWFQRLGVRSLTHVSQAFRSLPGLFSPELKASTLWLLPMWFNLSFSLCGLSCWAPAQLEWALHVGRVREFHGETVTGALFNFSLHNQRHVACVYRKDRYGDRHGERHTERDTGRDTRRETRGETHGERHGERDTERDTGRDTGRDTRRETRGERHGETVTGALFNFSLHNQRHVDCVYRKDRYGDRHGETHGERHGERHTERDTGRETRRETRGERHGETHGDTGRDTGRHTERDTGRDTRRETRGETHGERHTERDTERDTRRETRRATRRDTRGETHGERHTGRDTGRDTGR
ncbi:uncharacterized protein LOC142923309 [Petromyzon marinus]|uniref:uncharacterized protein LOC142923309 n=1 Tax=Petromyzon marinus TaxID=7757 RepID=UPI003F709714